MAAKNLLRFPHKQIRAEIIKQYMEEAGYERAVCFSCGNAAAALQAAGVDVLHIGERGDLTPNRWFSQAEIARAFPNYFDATSGHLPAALIIRLSAAYRAYIGKNIRGVEYVPTGSGETLISLKLAYPDKKFIAVYNLDKATEYSPDAPLNKFVEVFAAGIEGL